MAAAATGAGDASNAGTVEARRADAGTVDLAEQHIPRPPVVLHGIFAVSTLVLVLHRQPWFRWSTGCANGSRSVGSASSRIAA